MQAQTTHQKKYLIIFLIIYVLKAHTQNQYSTKIDTIYKDSIPIKILYDNKIYKLNAGFATFGTGYLISNNTNHSLNSIGITFNFHLFKDLFIQAGFNRIKSYQNFYYPQRKSIQVSYFNFILSPWTIKTESIRFAFIFNPLGITYGGGYKDETYHYKGTLTTDSTNTIQNNYFGMNLYSSIHGYYKFKYDLGIGADVYAEYNTSEFMMAGIKISLYFSAAFRGNQTKPAWYYKRNPDKN